MINLTINGTDHQFDGDEEMPLLWYLRDEIDQKGTKFGCGEGLCGACTVHLDGTAIRACVTQMGDLDGASVTTIEGLDHALKAAWIKHKVPQCGYCQAGQIMQAAALLAENPNPSDEDIEGAMWGNICRCGTYQRIKLAIRSVVEA